MSGAETAARSVRVDRWANGRYRWRVGEVEDAVLYVGIDTKGWGGKKAGEDSDYVAVAWETPGETKWRARIREHLRANLSIEQEGFEVIAIFADAGRS